MDRERKRSSPACSSWQERGRLGGISSTVGLVRSGSVGFGLVWSTPLQQTAPLD